MKFVKPIAGAEPTPAITQKPSTMNRTMAITLAIENQYSNEPNAPTLRASDVLHG